MMLHMCTICHHLFAPMVMPLTWLTSVLTFAECDAWPYRGDQQQYRVCPLLLVLFKRHIILHDTVLDELVNVHVINAIHIEIILANYGRMEIRISVPGAPVELSSSLCSTTFEGATHACKIILG